MILAGGEGRRLWPLTAGPRQARGAVRRALPHHRHRPVELRQLGPAPHQGPHAVQERVARGAHRARVAPVADARPLHRDHPRAAAHGQELVPGLGRRRLPDQHVITDEKPGSRLHLRRRPRLQDGRPPDARLPPRARAPMLTVAAIPVPREPRRSDFGVIEVRRRGAHRRRSTRRSQDPPPMPGQPGHGARVDGQLHLQDRRRCSRRSSATRAATSRHARLRPRHPPGHASRAGARLRLRLRRRTSCPARTSASAATGATSGRSRPTGKRRWISSRSSPLFNLYNRRWPIRTGINARSAGQVRLPRRSRRRASASPPTRWSPTAASSPAVASTAACCRRACRVNSFSEVEECVLFEDVNIGRHAKLRRAIIDKDVEIPPSTRSATTSRRIGGASSSPTTAWS